jgi:hypothetical protein
MHAVGAVPPPLTHLAGGRDNGGRCGGSGRVLHRADRGIRRHVRHIRHGGPGSRVGAGTSASFVVLPPCAPRLVCYWMRPCRPSPERRPRWVGSPRGTLFSKGSEESGFEADPNAPNRVDCCQACVASAPRSKWRPLGGGMPNCRCGDVQRRPLNVSHSGPALLLRRRWSVLEGAVEASQPFFQKSTQTSMRPPYVEISTHGVHHATPSKRVSAIGQRKRVA